MWVHVHTWAWECVYVQAFMHGSVGMCVCERVCVHVCACVHTGIHAWVCGCMCLCMYLGACMCTRVHTTWLNNSNP